MTGEEFKGYWENKHDSFFMENADAMGAKKYVQSHTLVTPLNQGLRDSRGMTPEYDGVTEVWFESKQALVEAMRSPESQKLGKTLLKMKVILSTSQSLPRSLLKSTNFNGYPPFSLSTKSIRYF